MLFKKVLVLSVSIILSCGYIPTAQANIACRDEFSEDAFGSLEKSDLDRLKKRYVAARRSITDKVPLYNDELQGILGFSGEQTKIASNGIIEHRIWIDRDSCKRKVKASFKDGELVTIRSYGF